MNVLSRREGREMVPVSALFDRLFHEPFFAGMTSIPAIEEGSLALDVSEDDQAVVVRASLPGFKRDEIEIEVEDGVLAIRATHGEEREEKSERYYRKERRFGSVSRRIALPTTVVEDQAKAELKDGVLVLRLPKSPAALPKKVKIS